ncbi:MAG: sulfite reductase subunit C, partial [Clostridium sp.]|uniref:sulfite reductase subunit C n=1 Tax=Clostridium sp. TaxID=1506 RepID=UPI003EE56263
DIDIKKLRKNCFRQSKVPGEFMLQMRIPGGVIEAKYLKTVQEIAEKFGNGTFHMGMRQTFDIPGIKYENVEKANEYIEEYIKAVQIDECNCDMEKSKNGYPYIGPRNVMACIGNTHCIKANVNTKEMANKIEELVYPSPYHIKVSVAGCPNDCAKGHFQDFGVIGQTRNIYHEDRCIGCGACVRACEKHATRVLTLNDKHKIDKDDCCCVGCGECVIACPASAWTREEKKYYRVVIGGRTGKQTPRMGKTFLNYVTEDVVLAMFANWQKFSSWALDYKPEYLHGGHLIDRAGYHKFKEIILDGVELNEEALVAENIFWAETEYRSNFNVKPMVMHKTINSNREMR